jgi:hypothetical protein
MNLLEKIGIALRDGVYELFMEYSKTTDLKELKEAGYAVKELPLSPHPANTDKLYILTRGKVIHCACSLVIIDGEPEVKFHTPLEAIEVVKRITRAIGSKSFGKHIH